MRRISVLCLATLVAVLPASAQNDVCIDPQTGQIDQTATAGWQQFQAAADQQAVAALTGVWYTEVTNPATGQVDYRYHALEPNGLFSYQSRVCDQTGFCSDYAGHGFWAAQTASDGSFAVMTIVSDLSRSNLCGISYSRLAGDQLHDNLGGVWLRTR